MLPSGPNRFKLDLILKVKKRDFSTIAHRSIALDTIYSHFPPKEWLHIYTDGTLLNISQGTGEDAFSDSFSFYLHVGTFTTYFDEEL
ncbi:hypothetical protein NPIL_299411 [Nephila pilipes]|uniref:Uncharacterized protein n=1 Tax=Nephila pilipes TaxID=299642 RepID=A0A8X6Q5I3_NEPPI|nr:hypothetical protein NPIL_299411 [Nephila pilipes]